MEKRVLVICKDLPNAKELYRQELMEHPDALGYSMMLETTRPTAEGSEHIWFKTIRQVPRLEGYRFDDVLWSHSLVKTDDYDLLRSAADAVRMMTLHVPKGDAK